jgi:hypothetical protein
VMNGAEGKLERARSKRSPARSKQEKPPRQLELYPNER